MEDNQHKKLIRVRKSVSTEKQGKEPQRGMSIAKLEENRKREQQMQAFLIPDLNEIPTDHTSSLVNTMNPSSNQSFDSNSSLSVSNNERVYSMTSIGHSIEFPPNQSVYNNLSSALLHNGRDNYALNKSDKSRSHGIGKAPYVYYDNQILRDFNPSSSAETSSNKMSKTEYANFDNGEYIQPTQPTISPCITLLEWYLAHQVIIEDPSNNSRQERSILTNLINYFEAEPSISNQDNSYNDTSINLELKL